MELKEFFFHQAIVEFKYRDGYKCLDVPGEIMRRWAAKFDPGAEWGTEGLRMQRAADSFRFEVFINRMAFTMTEVSTFDYFRDHVAPIGEDILNLLDIREPERAGFRVQLVYPLKSRREGAEMIDYRVIHSSKELWNVLGDTPWGAGIMLHGTKGGLQRRLAINTVERTGPKKGPDYGIMVDFDYSAHENFSNLRLRSFMNEGFTVLRDQILPLCDPILK